MLDLLASALIEIAQPKQRFPTCNAPVMLRELQRADRPAGVEPTRIEQCADRNGYALVRYRAIWQGQNTTRYATFVTRDGAWKWDGTSPYRDGILDSLPRYAADYLETQVR